MKPHAFKKKYIRYKNEEKPVKAIYVRDEGSNGFCFDSQWDGLC